MMKYFIKNYYFRLLLIGIFFSLFFIGCVTPHPDLPNEICPGITYKYVSEKNKLLRYHLVTVDLSTPNLEIISSENMTKEAYDGETTYSFAKKTDATIAINGTLFYYPKGKLSVKRNLLGLCIANGKEYCEAKKEYAAIVFSKTEDNTYKATILDSQTEPLPQNTAFAIGGFHTVIKNNEIISRKTPKDSRTACGISQDGKFLTILIVEGEDKLHSKGLTFDECAEILLKNGVHTALQLDGGGSSSLIINGKNALTYWKPRPVAHNFGFIYK